MNITVERIDDTRYKYYNTSDTYPGVLKIINPKEIEIEEISSVDKEFPKSMYFAKQAKYIIYKMLRDGKLEDKVMKAWG